MEKGQRGETISGQTKEGREKGGVTTATLEKDPKESGTKADGSDAGGGEQRSFGTALPARHLIAFDPRGRWEQESTGRELGGEEKQEEEKEGGDNG